MLFRSQRVGLCCEALIYAEDFATTVHKTAGWPMDRRQGSRRRLGCRYGRLAIPGALDLTSEERCSFVSEIAFLHNVADAFRRSCRCYIVVYKRRQRRIARHTPRLCKAQLLPRRGLADGHCNSDRLMLDHVIFFSSRWLSSI